MQAPDPTSPSSPSSPAAPSSIALSQNERIELERLVTAAREHQRSATRKAIDEALTHVPALLRGAVKKLLFPS